MCISGAGKACTLSGTTHSCVSTLVYKCWHEYDRW